MWKRLPKYSVEKKQAFKIEKIEAPNRPVQSNTHTRYFSYTKKERPKVCVICGSIATHTAFFRVQEIDLLEKYCTECLEKYVIQ